MKLVEKKGCHIDAVLIQETKKGKMVCGDSSVIVETEDYMLCGVIDGLGSGEEAYRSSSKVAALLEGNHENSVEDLLELCNKALLGMRGAAVTLLKFDYKRCEVHYANLGNVTFTLYGSGGQLIRPIPKRGFLSGKKVNIKLEIYPYQKSDIFILYSDGMRFSSEDVKRISTISTLREIREYVLSIMEKEFDDTTILIGYII